MESEKQQQVIEELPLGRVPFAIEREAFLKRMQELETNAVHALNEIRRHLKAGAVIMATDPDGRVLEFLPDGTIHGGMTI